MRGIEKPMSILHQLKRIKPKKDFQETKDVHRAMTLSLLPPSSPNNLSPGGLVTPSNEVGPSSPTPAVSQEQAWWALCN